MKSILYNPYRNVGLLIGATAREQDRQVKRLRQFIEAEQEPEQDFSFPAIGVLNRNLESISDSASKLNLNNDKMNAALFWFYNGNAISDEPAFEALKDGKIDEAISIWNKLTLNADVSKRNASAFFNLATLYLSSVFANKETQGQFFELGIHLKLKFLESNFTKEFKDLAADETLKISKKDIQLLFLRQVLNEAENKNDNSSIELLGIISSIEFTAREDFYKVFIEKPIEQIETKIEETKVKRKENKSLAVSLGTELFEQTEKNLILAHAVWGENSIKYSSIVDKVANEALQCSIDYFNYHQDANSEFEYVESALKLAKIAEKIALGKLTKDRIADCLNTLDEMKDKEISQAIKMLIMIKEAFEQNKAKINMDVLTMHLGPNQTINWNKVNKMIDNCLDWEKVTTMIKETIPLRNVEKIKNHHNTSRVVEFKELMNFVVNKLSFSQVNQVKYICYWKTENTVTNVGFTINSFPVWAKWLGGIAISLLVILGIWGKDGVENVLGIALFFGFIYFIGWIRSH